MLTLLFVFYLIVATAAVASTFLEGRRKQLSWSVARLSGLLLAIAWPLLIAVVAVSAAKPKQADLRLV